MRTHSRREFLEGSLLAASTTMAGQKTDRGSIGIVESSSDSAKMRLAKRELMRGLTLLRLPNEIRWVEGGGPAEARNVLFQFRVNAGGFQNDESYSISRRGSQVELSGGSEGAALLAVFDFLERQGAYFGVDGEAYPPEPARSLALPSEDAPWTARPHFKVRGLLPYPDFLNCITVYNDEDFRAYFEAMMRMRLNTFGMHVYSSPESFSAGTESYLSFRFAGARHRGFLDNSASGRWGSLPQKTSDFGMGAANYFSGEVFGADATTKSANLWESADRTRDTLRKALTYARSLGIACGIGFEPYQIPEDTLRALPPIVKPKEGARFPGGAAFDVESTIARKLLEARLGQLLEAYPEVDYVWLWEDEKMNWESRKSGIPLSVTPFQQAYDFLRRNAPRKRMVLSGWGGVVRHFEYFHKRLPMDIVFSCLNDSMGWDPVHETFAKLEGRERWPIPWLEDDPTMWLPQFHVNRMDRDVKLAQEYGCQGMLGIHWRNRAMDANAGYLARSSWDQQLTPAAHFAHYARTQAPSSAGTRLGAVLQDADLKQSMLHSGTDEREGEHVVWREWAADYAEGFPYWKNYEPDSGTMAALEKFAADLRQFANASMGSEARERSNYLAGFVGFTVPYAHSWTVAHRLNKVLEHAAKLKADRQIEEARRHVNDKGVPLMIELAPLVRESMLMYQGIIANRSEVGQLASMHDKYVRLTLYRLPLEMEEYLEELPSQVKAAIARALEDEVDSSVRVFVPTRPGILRKGERLRIDAVVAGSGVVDKVMLHTRLGTGSQWNATPAKLLDRRTYQAFVEAPSAGEGLMAYYVSAWVRGKRYDAPESGARTPWLVTLC